MSTPPTAAKPGLAHEQDAAHWEQIWKEGLAAKTRWDIGEAEPDLVFELGNAEGVLAGLVTEARKGERRALVPGCGRGYAVAALGEAGFESVGFDISASAMEVARKECPHPKAEYVVGDFFDSKGFGDKQFDLVFDSTFFCAIPPLMRKQWAKRMDEIIAPGGFLVMQLFPVSADPNAPELSLDGPLDEPGPPFRVTVKQTRQLLEPYPFKEVLLRETPVARAARQAENERKEFMMIFQKQSS